MGPNPSLNRTRNGVPAWASFHSGPGASHRCAPVSSNYKGFPTFVKQKSLVVESRSD